MDKKCAHKKSSDYIDGGLTILNSITPNGLTWSQTDICEIIDCSKQVIWLAENSALIKLRRNKVLRQYYEDIKNNK